MGREGACVRLSQALPLRHIRAEPHQECFLSRGECRPQTNRIGKGEKY